MRGEVVRMQTDWEEVTITVERMASSGVAGSSERMTRDNNNNLHSWGYRDKVTIGIITHDDLHVAGRGTLVTS